MSLAKILVVEDDASLLRAVTRVLVDLGHDVHGAATAEAAVAAASGFKADLLLADWLLRESRGIEVALAIRDKLPAVRTLFMTGLSAESIRKEAAQVSPWPILEKPIDLDAVEAAVNQALAQQTGPATIGTDPHRQGGREKQHG